jgi:hypothetical protein
MTRETAETTKEAIEIEAKLQELISKRAAAHRLYLESLSTDFVLDNENWYELQQSRKAQHNKIHNQILSLPRIPMNMWLEIKDQFQTRSQ